MLTFEEFIGKKTIILNKSGWICIWNRIEAHNTWNGYSICKNTVSPMCYPSGEMTDEKAYEKYREAMESYGFKQFPMIIE